MHQETPRGLQKPMADLVDAFLYVGPPNPALREQFVKDAENPLYPAPEAPDAKSVQEAVRAELPRPKEP